MNNGKQITLAIESAIAGGSLSLLSGTGSGEIANWIGEDTNATRAEDLLLNIDNLLSSAGVSKQDLALIAVSAGPGSFTGIRVGMATALGLKNGLGIPMCSSSVLNSIVTAKAYLAVTTPTSSTLLFCSAIPSGRHAVCLQSFEVGEWSLRELSEPWTMKEPDLPAFIGEQQDFHFLLQSDLVNNLGATQRVTDVGKNLAQCVAQACFANRRSTSPLFISKSF